MMAPRLPTNILRTATEHNSISHAGAISGIVSANTRKKAANAAAFGPTDIKAVTGVGEPW